MNYMVFPLLQNAAFVKTASLFFFDSEIVNMIKEHMGTPRFGEQVGTKIAERLSSQIPLRLLKRLATVILYMHREVKRWETDHSFLLDHIGPSRCAWLCWKTEGTINRTQTAKNIVASDSIDAKSRFLLACTYFLEEEASSLWKRFSEGEKMEITIGISSESVRFWIKWLVRRDNRHWSELVDDYFKIPSAYPLGVHLRLSSFYHFLSMESKNRYSMFFDFKISHHDDFQECVNVMLEEERTTLFRSKSMVALMNFFEWPYRHVFIEMARNISSYLTPHELSSLLHQMLNAYILDGEQDFKLLEELWETVPEDVKDRTKASRHFITMVSRFLEMERCPQELKAITRRCFFD